METSISYCGGGRMYFSSDERRWITRIRKLAAENPQDVRIIQQPEHNNGCIYAELSVDYLKIAPKRRVEFSDEQLAIMRERMKSIRKTNSQVSDEEQQEDQQEQDEQDEQQGGA